MTPTLAVLSLLLRLTASALFTRSLCSLLTDDSPCAAPAAACSVLTSAAVSELDCARECLPGNRCSGFSFSGGACRLAVGYCPGMDFLRVRTREGLLLLLNLYDANIELYSL